MDSDKDTAAKTVLTLTDYSGKEIKFLIDNEVCKWRADTLYTKEPLTISWLRTFTPDDIFWDVGANIGMYTMFASVVMGTPTYAFEPQHLNYAILNENILLNKVDDITKAYCIGISDEFKLGELSQGVSGVSAGGSAHTIGRRHTTLFRQGCVVSSIDKLVKRMGLKPPTRLKIDIDGLEPRVINGARQSLSNIHSILVELNVDNTTHMKVFDTLKSYGFVHNEQECRVTQSGKHKGNGEFLFKNTKLT